MKPLDNIACLKVHSLGYLNWTFSRCHLKKWFFALISFLHPRFVGVISNVTQPCDCPNGREIPFVAFPKFLEPCLQAKYCLAGNGHSKIFSLSTVKSA